MRKWGHGGSTEWEAGRLDRESRGALKPRDRGSRKRLPRGPAGASGGAKQGEGDGGDRARILTRYRSDGGYDVCVYREASVISLARGSSACVGRRRDGRDDPSIYRGEGAERSVAVCATRCAIFFPEKAFHYFVPRMVSPRGTRGRLLRSHVRAQAARLRPCACGRRPARGTRAGRRGTPYM